MNELLPVKNFQNPIFEFRGINVMIDVDLAASYETGTKKIKTTSEKKCRQFPNDFMFERTKEEKEQLIASASRLIFIHKSNGFYRTGSFHAFLRSHI